MEFKEIQNEAIRIRNLYHEFEKEKCGKIWSNTEIAMGFVGDVGDLMKLIMVKEGLRKNKNMKNIDQDLKDELSDCLWSILVLCNKYNINMETEFMNSMKKLETRILNKENH